jgi:hypothetical protein
VSWDQEIPRYRTTRALHPSALERHRQETPWSFCSDNDCWQYCGENPLEAHEEVATTAWPHPSFQPLTTSARRIHEFFLTRDASRLPVSPWSGNSIRPELAKAMVE